MFDWVRRKFGQSVAVDEPEPTRDAISTHTGDRLTGGNLKRIALKMYEAQMQHLLESRPTPIAYEGSYAMDAQDVADVDGNGSSSLKNAYSFDEPAVAEVLLLWYGSQSFIGSQMCAILMQHWLIDKAVSMPALDATRKGYKITSADGGELKPEVIQAIKKADKKYRTNVKLVNYVRFGRAFGIRVAYFKIRNVDPLYYEKPFNIDSVTKGTYQGMVMVDPYWCYPMLDSSSVNDPSSLDFYEPTFWQINGKRYHKSHLVIFRNSELPDLMKPAYLYGGVPVPQQIMERVYAAERTANEGPLLAMTKRTTVLGVDITKAFANKDKFDENVAWWMAMRDNRQIKVIDKVEESVEQFDTSLADLSDVIMTQYQIVAAAARVPATKLLGTTPKGFNSTGDYETESYHEELETLQIHGLSPLLERHHMIVMRSDVAPALGIAPIDISHAWEPLGVPTALEVAQTNLAKAQTGAALVQSNAIDGYDERDRIINDEQSGYHGIAEAERPEGMNPVNNPDADADGTQEDKVGAP